MRTIETKSITWQTTSWCSPFNTLVWPWMQEMATGGFSHADAFVPKPRTDSSREKGNKESFPEKNKNKTRTTTRTKSFFFIQWTGGELHVMEEIKHKYTCS